MAGAPGVTLPDVVYAGSNEPPDVGGLPCSREFWHDQRIVSTDTSLTCDIKDTSLPGAPDYKLPCVVSASSHGPIDVGGLPCIRIFWHDAEDEAVSPATKVNPLILCTWMLICEVHLGDLLSIGDLKNIEKALATV